jgi:hypothetical protein
MGRMDILTREEIDEIIGSSRLVPYYNREVDRESAYEILGAKMDRLAESSSGERGPGAGTRGGKKEKEPPSVLEQLSKNTMARQIGRTVFRELTRGLLGALGGGKRRR